MRYEPRSYQTYITKRIIDTPGVGPWVDMGLGKTVSTLTAFNELIFDQFEISKPLVIAPKKVAENVWTDEVEKWDHLNHIRCSLILGSERQRKEALLKKADLYVINRENVPWLVAHYGTAWPFDAIIIDESSSFKNPSSKRFKALRKVLPFAKRVVCLTGTPAPNSELDLWSQVYCLDRGKRLGETFTSYRDKYFQAGKRNGQVIYNYDLKGDETEVVQKVKGKNVVVQKGILGADINKAEIHSKISDICFSMKTEDFLDLPERLDTTTYITLPEQMHERYLEFEKKQVLTLMEGTDISAVNAAALTTKLLQFANGAMYDDDKNWHEVHTEKIESLIERLESANGRPVMVFYSYKHDLERIFKYLKKYKPEKLENTDSIKRWNRGEIPLMAAHPASAGHGLNLQFGGNHIEWFGLQFNLELYQQAIKRIHRSGQTQVVINNRNLIRGTIDEDVLAALDNKANSQDALIRAVKARIDKYRSYKS